MFHGVVEGHVVDVLPVRVGNVLVGYGLAIVVFEVQDAVDAYDLCQRPFLVVDEFGCHGVGEVQIIRMEFVHQPEDVDFLLCEVDGLFRRSQECQLFVERKLAERAVLYLVSLYFTCEAELVVFKDKGLVLIPHDDAWVWVVEDFRFIFLVFITFGQEVLDFW